VRRRRQQTAAAELLESWLKITSVSCSSPLLLPFPGFPWPWTSRFRWWF